MQIYSLQLVSGVYTLDIKARTTVEAGLSNWEGVLDPESLDRAIGDLAEVVFNTMYSLFGVYSLVSMRAYCISTLCTIRIRSYWCNGPCWEPVRLARYVPSSIQPPVARLEHTRVLKTIALLVS